MRQRPPGKRHREGASLTRATCNIDMTAMGAGNGSDQAEPKTGAMLWLTLITCIEPLEDMGQILLRDSNARISDGNGDLSVVDGERSLDGSL